MHPEIDRFAHLDTVIHRWDARWKLGSILLLMLAIGSGRIGQSETPSWSGDLPPVAGCLALSLALVGLSGVPLVFVIRRLRSASIFLLLLVCVFSVRWGPPLRLSADGFLSGFLVALRVLSLILLVFPAFGTTRFDDSMKALRRLHLPEMLVHTILLSYRYLFVSADQLRRMENAMRARGFRAGLNLHTIRTLGNGIGVLLVGSIERTQRIYGAMKCRGYSGTFRTLEDFQTTPMDVALSILVVGCGVGLFVWGFSD